MYVAELRLNIHVKILVTVAGVYLALLYVLYRCAPLLRGETDNGIVYVANTTEQNDAVVDVYKLQWKPKDKVFFKKVKRPGETDTDRMLGSGPQQSSTPCNGKLTGTNSPGASFVKVSEGVFIYSAYYDNRLDTRYIRIIGAIKSTKGVVNSNVFVNKICMIEDTSETNVTSYITTKMSFYEMCENHKRVYGGWIMSCEIPEDVKGVPYSVRLYGGNGELENLDNSHEICIKSREMNTERRKLNYGICVPPIYGTVKPKQLVEFIELHRILGVEKFIFYIEISQESITLDVKKILRYYTSLKIVVQIPWALPFRPDLIWYHGQSLAINDCLYRHMNEFNHLAFIDLDEFIIPQNSFNTWDDVLQNLKDTDRRLDDTASGYTFRTTYFSDEFSRRVFSSEMSPVVRTNRTRYFSYRRNKVLVRPVRVFELGIHHVSRPWPDYKNYTVVKVPTSVAFIHHYRTCVREFGIACNNRVVDSTVAEKYGKILKDNYFKILYDITY